MRTSPHPQHPQVTRRHVDRGRGPGAGPAGAAALALSGLAAAALGPLLLRGALVRGAELAHRPGTGVDELVLVLATAAAGVLLLWLLVTGAASAAALLLRRRGVRWAALDALERRVVPGLVRRAVAAGLGASVVVGLAAPAALAAGTPWAPRVAATVTASPSAGAPGPVEVSAAAGPVPLWPAEADAPAAPAPVGPVPAAPPAAAPRSTGPTPALPTTALPTTDRAGTSSRVVVAVGDSLWELAEQALGPGGDEAAVAQEWPRWWAANRAVIGDDPDLLQPGQVLQTPGERR